MEEEPVEEEPMEDEPTQERRENAQGPPLIENLGRTGKKVVKLRRKLKSEEEVQRFLRELDELTGMSEHKVVFEDFDIAQNPLSTESFEQLFSILSQSKVHIERFRAFGCPTFDDQVCSLMAEWLRDADEGFVPCEMHLSDNAITGQGFQDVMEAIEMNDAFPGPDPRNPHRKDAVMVRLESNYIDEKVIKDKAHEGTLKTFRKSDPRGTSDPRVKVRILVREDGSFQQRKGPPPASNDERAQSAMMKKVIDFGSEEWEKQRRQGRDKGKGRGTERESTYTDCKGQSRGDYSRRDDRYDSYNRDSRSDRSYGYGRSDRYDGSARYDRRDDYYRDSRNDRYGKHDEKGSDRKYDRGYDRGQWPAVSSDRRDGVRRTIDKSSSSVKAPWAKDRSSPARDERAPRRGPSSSRRGSGPSSDRLVSSRPTSARPSSVQDRSSSGPVRELGRDDRKSATTVQPKESKPSSGGVSGPSRPSKLPYPWEEHWNEDYKLPYFWNSKTGESLWEAPKA